MEQTVQTFRRDVSEAAAQPRAMQSDAAAAPQARGRVPSIDRLRGLVILLMALDHVRDYFTNVRFSATDLAQTSAPLFLTRWITHFCAPTFIFLAGTSAFLLSQRMTRPALARFLLARGVWLIVLEFTVVSFVWTFNFDYPMGLIMQVIWATGVSMCVLAGLIALPPAAVAAFGIALIAGHNLLDGIRPESFGAWAPLWKIVHVQAQIPVGVVLYPLVPWVGVMAAGYGFGTIYRWDPARRLRALRILGGALCVAFISLRALNAYGDPSPWAPARTWWLTALSFLNVTKYPPSLMYVVLTLGPALLVLAWLERRDLVLLQQLETFGRVPMFAYVVHIALAHLLAGLLALALGHGGTILGNIFIAYPKEWGFGLPGVYVAWLVVLTLLYPLCRWFAALKRRRSDWWLAYL
jgi:uncharacterized membrane protein